MLPKGLIVSIQGYSKETTEELAANAANAGAVAIRSDKSFLCRLPIIGLTKEKVSDRKTEPYITPTLEAVKSVKAWTQIIAVDYRRINSNNIREISAYAKEKNLEIIADIGEIEDYYNICENDFYCTYIASTFMVLHKRHYPDIDFLKELAEEDKEKIIAEGNIQTRQHVKLIDKIGIPRWCIGSAISDIYKLTKKYVTAVNGGNNGQ